MKRHWIAPLILAAALAAGTPGRALAEMHAATDTPPSPRPADDLIERVHAAELKIGMAKAVPDRVKALDELKRYLDQALLKLPKTNPDDATRRLRGSLSSLQGYLGKIDTRKFDPKRCASYRAQILLGFSPHEQTPAYVPGEARESLKILAAVCGQPELAEVPGQGPPPKAPGSG